MADDQAGVVPVKDNRQITTGGSPFETENPYHIPYAKNPGTPAAPAPGHHNGQPFTLPGATAAPAHPSILPEGAHVSNKGLHSILSAYANDRDGVPVDVILKDGKHATITINGHSDNRSPEELVALTHSLNERPDKKTQDAVSLLATLPQATPEMVPAVFNQIKGILGEDYAMKNAALGAASAMSGALVHTADTGSTSISSQTATSGKNTALASADIPGRHA